MADDSFPPPFSGEPAPGTPHAAPAPTPAPAPATSRNGLIIGGIVAVAAVIIGVVVIAGGGDDQHSATPGSTTSAGAGGTTVTTDNGDGTSNNGGDPNDPCSSVNLSTDLGANNLDAVGTSCDGTWTVAGASGTPQWIARYTDGAWVPIVDLTTTGLCHDDTAALGWPAAVIDAATWPCTTFAAPQAGAYIVESGQDQALDTTMTGPRVAALQFELSRNGLLAPDQVDGMFGAGTRQALIVYQAYTGLPVSAKGDLGTLHHMGLLAAERVSLSTLVTNGAALGDLVIGGNGRRVPEYLTGFFGPPDAVDVVALHPDHTLECTNSTTYYWSGLRVTVVDAKVDSYDYSDTEVKLDITSPNGRRVGMTYDEWKSKYSHMDGGSDYFTVDQGLHVRAANGVIIGLSAGDARCV